MNPRITELAEQAFQSINDISTEGVADYHTFEQAWFQVYNQKFAQLIVQECAEFIEQDQGSGHELANRLKKHFGVES